MIAPKLFFPTTTLFIDDSEEFLQSVSSTLAGDDCHFVFFESPEKAFKFLQEYFFKHHFTVSSPINFLRQPDRHQLISSIIADYRMYPLNGLDFFLQLQEIAPENTFPFRKILLTGDDSLQLHQALASQPIVNKIIRKSEKNLVRYIETSVKQENALFFRELSEKIPINNALFPIGDTNRLQALFQSLLRKIKALEYYWLNSDQDCLVIDSNRTTHRVFFRSEEYVTALRSLLDQSPDESLRQSLHQRLSSELPYTIDINELGKERSWENIPWKGFQMASSAQGTIYYGSFIDETNFCD
jgi:CheY-like chemotaxis protein